MLSFYQLEEKINSEFIAENYFESIVQSNTKDNTFRYPRSKGIVKQNDPINQFKTNNSDINIVWITGMWSSIFPGTGNYSSLLKPLGYNIQVVKTLADMKSAGLGRIVRHLPFLNPLHQKWAQPHVAKNQEKVLGEIGDSEPDVIIGSSQGGAIALSIAPRFKDAPMLLLCPAWKIFGVNPTYLNSSSSIIHGIHDVEVPLEDSIELSKKFGVPLIKTEDGHIMNHGISILLNQLYNLTQNLVLLKNKKMKELERSKNQLVAMESMNNFKINIWVA